MGSNNMPNTNHSANGSRETSDFRVSHGRVLTDEENICLFAAAGRKLFLIKKLDLAQERCHHLVDWRRQVPVLRRLTVHIGQFGTN